MSSGRTAGVSDRIRSTLLNRLNQGTRHMQADRRDFLKASAAAASASFFTGRVLGANDRVNAAFIGMGKMGRANLSYAMKQENLQVAAVCDVFERNLGWAAKSAKEKFPEVKALKDFREILA